MGTRTRTARMLAAALSLGAVASMAVTAWSGASAAASITKGAKVTYSKPITVPAPPRSLASSTGNGDGFDLSFADGQIYNVFHHGSQLKVDCHVQATGAQCTGFATPALVQGPGAVNFTTSAGSSTAINPSTNHLFVYTNLKDPLTVGGTTYATATAGVVEVDLSPTATDRFVRFIRTTPDGEGPYLTQTYQDANNVTQTMYMGAAGVARLVGTRFYAMNNQASATTPNAFNKLMCVDISTQAACAGQPYEVGLDTGITSSGGGAVQLLAAGSRLYFPFGAATGCFDTTTSAKCSGSWPVSSGGGILPTLSTSGADTGICVTTGNCFGLDGTLAAPPANLTDVMSGLQSYGRWTTTLGTRLYGPTNFGTANLLCYDFATSAACPNFPASYAKPVQGVYTVQSDPANPTCLWINADSPGGSVVNGVYTPDPTGARIQTVDAYSGGACGASGSRVLLSSFIEAGAACEPTKWGTLTITSTTALTKAALKVQNGSGSDLATATMTLSGDAKTATLDLSTVTLTAGGSIPLTAPFPSLLLDLTDAGGALATPVTSALSWEGTFDEACLARAQTATDGTSTVTGTPTTLFPTTTTIATTTTLATTTTVAPTTTAAAATTTVAQQVTTTVPAPSTTTSAPSTTTTTSIAPLQTTTVPVSVLGVAVNAPTSSTMPLPVAAPASAPAFTGGNDLDLTLAALALIVMASVVLTTEKLTRRDADANEPTA